MIVADLSKERINPFKDENGMIDEYKMIFSLRDEFPLHYQLFRRMNSHISSEANAESTFSLSGKLSNNNRQTDSDNLSCLVRIESNRKNYTPSSDEVFKAYKSKFGNTTLGDDVEDLSSDASDSDSDSSDSSIIMT